ncbi:MAG TPA: ribonuclease III [Clostridiales bacterium]|nr:ribonuclease III [Clostridiales bacterium]
MVLDNDHIKKLEKTFGYIFKNTNLLKKSLTHSSYANEMHINKALNNERLEFLGDAVLELITSEYVYNQNPELPEGDLTKLRASIVCEQALAYCSRELAISPYILLGKGEDITGGRERDSILSDTLEAIIGAIFLDGGFANAKEFIINNIFKNIDNKELFFDSKTILQEYVQAEFKSEIEYRLIAEEGPDHDKVFIITALVNNKEVGRGKGKTKKAAEQEAAHEAFSKYQKNNR